MSLADYLAQFLPAIDKEMRDAADRFLPEVADFDRMLRYALGWVDETGQPVKVNTGKRVRPTLVLLCAELAGGRWEQALPAAAAIELLHNFSLIHDDIEDNSPLRRGRPSVWKIWGVPDAINAGDAMFALAHRALWQLPERGISAPQVIEVARLFEDVCLELTRGQHLDMQFERRNDVTTDEYLDMIAGKSAALVAASAQIGAVLGGISTVEAMQYAEFGHNVGMAFQIRDDILGIWGDPAVTGKSAATDIISRKKSLPVLFGLERSPELTAIYATPNDDAPQVNRAVAILDELGAQLFSQDFERQYHEAAISFFSGMSDVEVVSGLGELVERLFGRGV